MQPVQYNVKSELKALGITGEEFIAKGWRSQVFKAHLGEQTVALKVASPETVQKESEFLKLANTASVGPKFIKNSEHIVVMQFIDGTPYSNWIQTALPGDIKTIILAAMDQARALDKLPLNHDQLSNAEKHVMVCGKTPYIIDFEKGSTISEARNVTALLNFFLLNPYSFYARVGRETFKTNLDELLSYATKYAEEKTEEAFRQIKIHI